MSNEQNYEDFLKQLMGVEIQAVVTCYGCETVFSIPSGAYESSEKKEFLCPECVERLNSIAG